MKLLGTLSVLVDKYRILDAVEVFSDMWIEDLKPKISGNFPNDLLLWLSISWVFRKATLFKAVTCILGRIGDGTDLQEMQEEFCELLPIPSTIYGSSSKGPLKQPHFTHTSKDALSKVRISAILVDSFMKIMISGYTPDTDLLCPREFDDSHRLDCDSMMLGSLTICCASFSVTK